MSHGNSAVILRTAGAIEQFRVDGRLFIVLIKVRGEAAATCSLQQLDRRTSRGDDGMFSPPAAATRSTRNRIRITLLRFASRLVDSHLGNYSREYRLHWETSARCSGH